MNSQKRPPWWSNKEPVLNPYGKTKTGQGAKKEERPFVGAS